MTKPIDVLLLRARGLKGAPGDDLITTRGKLDNVVILATGESNLVLNRLFAWSPPTNLKIWNNDNSAAQTIGTEFVDPDHTHIGGAISYAAELARNNPLQNHYLINVSMGGRSIAAWVGGFDFTWSTDTTETDPGIGGIRMNALQTELIVSHSDAHGYDRTGQLLWWAVGTTVRVEDAADPTNYIEFTTTDEAVDQDGWETVAVTVASSAGTLVNAAAVKLRVYPDMWQRILDTMAAALPQLNVSKIDQLVWWQSGNDAPFQVQGTPGYFHEQYGVDFEVLMDRFKSQTWFPARTPVIMWGMVSEATGGLINFRTMNNRLQRVAQADPENRLFVYHNLEGSLYWDPIPDFPEFAVHMTALGLYVYGISSAHAVLNRLGRNMPAGIVPDPENGSVYIEDGNLVMGEMSINPERMQMREAGGSNLRFLIESEGDAQIRVSRFSDDTTPPTVQLRKYRGTIDDPAAVEMNDVLGQLFFMGFDGTQPRITAEMRATLAGSGLSDMETRLSFFGCGPGSVAESEMLRLSVANGIMWGGNNIVIDANRNLRCRLYTLATLPLASPAGIPIYVTDASGLVKLAVSDGSIFRRQSDGAQIS